MMITMVFVSGWLHTSTSQCALICCTSVVDISEGWAWGKVQLLGYDEMRFARSAASNKLARLDAEGILRTAHHCVACGVACGGGTKAS